MPDKREPWLTQHYPTGMGQAEYVLKATTDPIVVLETLARMAKYHEDLMTMAVIDCRALGFSWGEIANALGISRQAAHRRFRGVNDDPDGSS